MRFVVSPEEIKRANIPHEIFLTNVIGNHILVFVSLLGMYGSFPWSAGITPTLSALLIGYSLWRARRSLEVDPWYVQCHWQVAARRTLVFVLMLAGLGVILLGGWAAHVYLGFRKEATMALIGGVGILPVMVVVLVLILMESEALYHANLCRLPDWVVERFPNPNAQLAEEPAAHH